MRKIRSFIISIIIMLIISMFSLLAVSILTYLFKWHADKAMVGIIITYILAGFAGGVCLKWLGSRSYDKEQIGIRQKAIDAFILSCIFMLLLFALSIFAFQNPFEITGRFLMICGLLVSSTFLGRIL